MIGRSRVFELQLETPMETASGTVRTRRGLLVRVEAKAGDVLGNGTGDRGDKDRAQDAIGTGEATPLHGWTEPYKECLDAIDAALDRLDADGRRAALAETEGFPAARHGLSLALADLDARVADEPLYRRLCASDTVSQADAEHRRVESVPVNATVGDGSVEETVTRAREAVGAGFRTLKVKVGARPVTADAARLEAIEDGVEGDVRLRVDANGAWTSEEAHRAIDAFPDLEYLEQPLAPGNLAGNADLRKRAQIALDETLAERSVDEVVDANAADVVVLKPMVLGGVNRGMTAAVTADEAGVDQVVTTTIDGTVARTAAVHLAAGIRADRACGLATADTLGADVPPDPTTVTNGELSVPQGPGHGVTVAWT